MSNTVIDDLRTTVREAAVKLHRYQESETAVRPAPDKWSKKEILGHLLDSAVNNHHRFVRAQLVELDPGWGDIIAKIDCLRRFVNLVVGGMLLDGPGQ